MKKNNDFRNITLEQLAEMVAKGFAEVHGKMATGFAEVHEKMATKKELEDLRKETQAGFAYINITLDKHMGDVRKQTDTLAHRVKRLEEAVFRTGK